MFFIYKTKVFIFYFGIIGLIFQDKITFEENFAGLYLPCFNFFVFYVIEVEA